MSREQARTIIRPATAADAAAVARVHIDAWRTTYRGIVPDEHLAKLSYEKREQAFPRWLERVPVFCVAEEPSAGIVGFADGGPDLEEDDSLYKGRLYAIYILEEYQRRGIGRELVACVAKGLAAAGLCSLLIWVLADNAGARRFYESLGGKAVRSKWIEIGGKRLEEIGYGWLDIAPLLL